MANMNYNRVVLDTIQPVKAARATDIPIVFAGTLGRFGAELRKAKTNRGELDCASFTLDFYNCKKSMDYALQLAKCDTIQYRGEKNDSIRVTAWRNDAVYVSELKPNQQIVGAGILRVGQDKDQNPRVEIIVSSLARLANKNQAPDQNGHYTKAVLDNIRPIRPNEGEIPVFFAGTRGKFDPYKRTINTKRGEMNVTNTQIDFYNQKSSIDYLLSLCPVNKIAYVGDKSSSVRASAFNYDADYIASLGAGDNIIGGGVMRVNHSEKYGDSMEISLTSVFRLAGRTANNNAPAQTQAAPTQATAYVQPAAPQAATASSEDVPYIYFE